MPAKVKMTYRDCECRFTGTAEEVIAMDQAHGHGENTPNPELAPPVRPIEPAPHPYGERSQELARKLRAKAEANLAPKLPRGRGCQR